MNQLQINGHIKEIKQSIVELTESNDHEAAILAKYDLLYYEALLDAFHT